jgi:hypothetical protein
VAAFFTSSLDGLQGEPVGADCVQGTFSTVCGWSAPNAGSLHSTSPVTTIIQLCRIKCDFNCEMMVLNDFSSERCTFGWTSENEISGATCSKKLTQNLLVTVRFRALHPAHGPDQASHGV